ncbi:restriction endonuclease subunit S [Vibrio sp. HA2012]|uniref:restriction endonuclease subunit S n=1 Tax=Vibrio sp. HA2012 TaxID=1971595 RepID=UPI000C2C6174|nr:restriction endonuclease subunit S [Vibrio sp. HA2012]PJC85597.1 restriction endonuclease subunit S [Vibrio sp. HA2012]
MSCNWIEIPLGDFIELKRGYDLPKSKRLVGQVPIVSSAGISDYHSESKVEGPGVVTGRYGTIGEVFYIEEDFWPLNTTLYVTDFKGNCPEFVYYLLKTFDFHKYSDKAAVPGVNRNHLHMEKVRVPQNVFWQEKLAKYLSKLDRKIVLNTQTNQTLEEMAQAIFKSWFVDFDPVKAKMNGEQAEGMDEATASLFPEKLVESELGLIPEGWKVSTLSSLIQLTGGGTPKRSEETYWNGDIPWFSVRDVPPGSNVFVVDTDEKITELGLNKSSTKLLPKGTTIITARGTVGKLALVGTDMCMNQSCYGIRGKEVGDYYNYFNLKQAVSTLQQNTHGAVFDTITTKTFDTYSLAFGGVELANQFDALIAPLLQKIEANVRQNIELSALRDTLLPKLLSGEIELGETEEMVEVS